MTAWRTITGWFVLPCAVTVGLALPRAIAARRQAETARRANTGQVPVESRLLYSMLPKLKLIDSSGKYLTPQAVGNAPLKLYIVANQTCSACQTLLESLSRHQAKITPKIDIFVVYANASLSEVQEFQRRYQLPVYSDPTGTLDHFGDLDAYPLALLTDGQGRVRYVHKGCMVTPKSSTDVVDNLLTLTTSEPIGGRAVSLWKGFTPKTESTLAPLTQNTPLLVTFLGKANAAQESRLTLLRRFQRDPALEQLLVRTDPETTVPADLTSANNVRVVDDPKGRLQRQFDIQEAPSSVLLYQNRSISGEVVPTNGLWMLSDVSIASLYFSKTIKH